METTIFWLNNFKGLVFDQEEFENLSWVITIITYMFRWFKIISENPLEINYKQG